MSPDPVLLHGWGRTHPTAGHLEHPTSPEEINLTFKDLQDGGSLPCIPRGLGRSYGDAAQSAGGTVLDMGAFNHIGAIDEATGTVTVGGGVSLGRLLDHCLPRGWFVPITPGTRHVSIGGAFAADVHGKNHHRDGGFADHTESITLVTPVGVREVSRHIDAELFWATSGAMGLTGAVTEATIRLLPVETSYVEVTTRRCANLAALMAAMEASDVRYKYSVAWVDTMIAGRAMGRSVLTQGNHALRDNLPPRERREPLQRLPGPLLTAPVRAPSGILNRATVGIFNEAWFRKSPKQPRVTYETLASYFYPLDRIGDWNLLYGRRGFVQYQFCVGFDHADVIERALALMTRRSLPSFLSVLKRFGPGDPGPISFPLEGWTLAVDLPVGPPNLASTLQEIDDLVAEAGGRVYLAKDGRLSPTHFAAMYPELPSFQAVQRRIDPEGVLGSDQSRRLRLTGAR